jgi:hypothetical protein
VEDAVEQKLHTNADGSYTVMLGPCPTATAGQLLDPSVPFVWVVGHSPHRVLKWWESDLPLARGEQPRRVRVRSLRCELLLGTAEFAEIAEQFDGVTIYQMARPVPDTLTVERLPEERLYPILRQVGLAAHFHQPHSMEVAMYRTWDRAWIDSLLAREPIARLVL